MSNILLLESDRLVANNITKFFDGLGHNVVWCADSQSAICQADTKTPDAIIMDLLLAGHSGVEFLYELRSYPEWNRLPVIVFSSLAPEELIYCQEVLSQLEITNYHYKPTTSLDRLGQSLSTALVA